LGVARSVMIGAQGGNAWLLHHVQLIECLYRHASLAEPLLRNGSLEDGLLPAGPVRVSGRGVIEPGICRRPDSPLPPALTADRPHCLRPLPSALAAFYSNNEERVFRGSLQWFESGDTYRSALLSAGTAWGGDSHRRLRRKTVCSE